MEWNACRDGLPPKSGWYEVKVRVQTDLFEDEETTRGKSVFPAWYDVDSACFRVSGGKRSGKVLHVDAWREMNLKTMIL